MDLCPCGFNDRLHGGGCFRVVKNRVRTEALTSVVGSDAQIEKGVFQAGKNFFRTHISSYHVKEVPLPYLAAKLKLFLF